MIKNSELSSYLYSLTIKNKQFKNKKKGDILIFFKNNNTSIEIMQLYNWEKYILKK